MLPMLVELKPQESAPNASRPVENRPANTRRMPSQALSMPRLLSRRPTISISTTPNMRPKMMETIEESTDWKPLLSRSLG